MERIFEVKLQHGKANDTYYVRATSLSTAASMALQADEASPEWLACKEAGVPYDARVVAAREFCHPEQFIA